MPRSSKRINHAAQNNTPTPAAAGSVALSVYGDMETCRFCRIQGCLGCDFFEDKKTSSRSATTTAIKKKRKAKQFRGVRQRPWGEVGGGDTGPEEGGARVAGDVRDGGEEAARAYDRAAIEFRGARAKLNFPLAEYASAEGAEASFRRRENVEECSIGSEEKKKEGDDDDFWKLMMGDHDFEGWVETMDFDGDSANGGKSNMI